MADLNSGQRRHFSPELRSRLPDDAQRWLMSLGPGQRRCVEDSLNYYETDDDFIRNWRVVNEDLDDPSLDDRR